jgi:hypothetical protein
VLSIASGAILISLPIDASSARLATPLLLVSFVLPFFLFSVFNVHAVSHMPSTQLISWMERMKMNLYVIIEKNRAYMDDNLLQSIDKNASLLQITRWIKIWKVSN